MDDPGNFFICRKALFGLVCCAMIALLNVEASALQSGGVEIGDLDTGSVVGQPFKELSVDVELIALCVGGQKAWYPPTSILDLQVQGTGGRPGHPVLIKLTNMLPLRVGFRLSADSAFAGPTLLNVGLTLNPGETKYIGIPISDLTYVTATGLIPYGSHIDHRMVGGQLLVFR